MIECQSKSCNWEFIFLGANIDSISTAQSFGISKAANYSATGQGVQSVYTTLSASMSNYRSSGTMEKDWSKDIK